jgi:energy-coupling factor transporter ATP-binding protein EcfA2
MSNQEQLHQQLEVFRAASQNLQLEPLVTQKDLARLGVEYQTDLIDELEQAIEDSTNQDNKLIFTGHRGCGKSTLLAELEFRLIESNQHFVVRFSISDTIERSAVDHVNILFSMAVQLLEAAERRAVNLNPQLKVNLYRWLAKHTQTELKSAESEIETSGAAEAKGGLPGILSFLAAIKAKLKVNSVIREEITTEFARRISDLIDKINEIQAYIEVATGKPVLVIIDDLDKLDLSVTDTIFSRNIGPLLDPKLCIIYTIPIATLRELLLRKSIEDRINQIKTMRVGKFFSKTTVRKRDRVPDATLIQVFEEILKRRISFELIDSEVRHQMILESGGVLRELIRIADRCCDKCLLEIRRRIRRSQFDQPPVRINQRILDEALSDLRNEYAEMLGLTDFDLLKSIYEQFKPYDIKNQRFLDLLHGLLVLEYRNGVQWYDLNPIVVNLLVQEGVIDDPN